jgi:hypothetical protein
MPLFYNKTFTGHYPVGTSALVIAPTVEEATNMLNQKLANIGLPQKVESKDMIYVSHKSQVIILNDGEY